MAMNPAKPTSLYEQDGLLFKKKSITPAMQLADEAAFKHIKAGGTLPEMVNQDRMIFEALRGKPATPRSNVEPATTQASAPAGAQVQANPPVTESPAPSLQEVPQQPTPVDEKATAKAKRTVAKAKKEAPNG